MYAHLVQSNVQTGRAVGDLVSPPRCIALYFFLLIVNVILAVGCGTDSKEAWEKKVSIIRWVAYFPPTADPDRGIEATPESIREDLRVLRKARFTGLVTYGSSGIMGRELPMLAQSEGFKGLIMGLWDPSSHEEIFAAEAAARLPIVLGFCIGNEGLQKRYKMQVLNAAIDSLRKVTGKPVTTTEEIDDYSDENLLRLGDWVFPNAHPYFHNQLDPEAAVQWTQAAYDDLKRRTDRFIIFKEVGLPTAGDSEGKLSSENQAKYYEKLAQTHVQFVFFEAFDQPWKTHLPIEPHWGIFHSDRTPKVLGLRLMGKEPLPSSSETQPSEITGEKITKLVGGESSSSSALGTTFYIYHDADYSNNHYKPTGYMGDSGDIHIDEVFEKNPRSGRTSIRIVYDAEGKGPNECPYPPPCRWAGVYWQEPPNNWGKDEFWKDGGFDLSRYNRLLFWARADKACTIEFKVGGINERYGDSLRFPRSIRARLSKHWQEFEINLEGANLKHVIGGFVWVTNWDTNPGGATFYLDEIRFERK